MRISDWSSDVCSSDLIAFRNQPLRDVDEVVERVLAPVGLARQIPFPPQIVAAADMRDGIDHAAVDEAESRRRKAGRDAIAIRSEEHTSELQSLMRISYAVFCLKKKTTTTKPYTISVSA